MADDGPVPPAERDQVLEPGHSSADSGTGIGLDTVDQVVAAHGWDISVTDSGWGGARFEITDVDRR